MLPVSVVIPARNEADNIKRLIDSLLSGDEKPGEIIVVDAGSTDGTAAAAAEAGARVLQVNKAYPGQARNVGIAHARYEIIACWDASMWVESETLRHLSLPLLREEADFSQGHLEMLPQTSPAALYLLLLLSPYNLTLPDGRRMYAPPVACTAFRRELWEKVGGFRPWRAREDSDFRRRVMALNPRVTFVPEAITYWEPSESWGALLRKVRLYGRHNLLSGSPDEWYGGLIKAYGTYFIASAVVGALSGSLYGLAAFLGAMGMGAGLRTLHKVVRNGSFFRRRTGKNPFHPATFGQAVMLLLSTDMASFVGALDWLFLDKLHLNPERFPEPELLGELSPTLPQ